MGGLMSKEKRFLARSGTKTLSLISKYQRSARTGHHTLSSLTEEKVEIFGIKMG